MTKNAVGHDSTSGTIAHHKLKSGIVDSNENYDIDLQQAKRISIKHQRSLKSATLQDHQVPQFLREPFITSGYRDSDNITVRQCLATLFTIHNETFNIWSHLVAFVGIFACSIGHISKHDTIGNVAVYPILCYTLVASLVLISSSLAHLFCCISWRARNTCFYIDYATISIFTFAAGQGFIFYSRPVTNESLFLYRFPYTFLGISFSFSCINMVLNCLSRHRLRKYRYLIRTGVYAVKFIFDISPFMAHCFVHGSTCNANTVYLFNRHMLFYVIAGVANASRLPERLLPGYCDLFGHSHHIFHVLIAMANFDAFNVMFSDMMEREDVLSASPYPPTFFTTFGLLILLTVFNSVVVFWFVRNWLTAEEEELFTGSKYLVVYKKESSNDNYLNNEIDITHKKKQ